MIFSNIAQCKISSLLFMQRLSWQRFVLVSQLKYSIDFCESSAVAVMQNELQESLLNVAPFQQLVSKTAKHRCETNSPILFSFKYI